ncbi:MAG: carboxymethylenebutenolidase, partial [Povalibacter sp.]
MFSRVELTRRRVLKTGLATGFALAVQPIAEATISTDDEGLTAGEVKVHTADIDIPAYRAMPA